jgi:tetratricopeptide (TPR) repeat protein
MLEQLKRFGFVIFILCAALSAQIAFGAESDSDVELHRTKAQKFIDAKDWASAEGEAKAIVEAKPQEADGWLMYGIIEQRLEHNDDAISAYHKYLDLNPPKEKADAVRGKLADLEIRSTKQQNEVKAEHEETYGPRSSGIFFAYAPVYNPSTSSVLGGDVSSNIQFGIEINRVIAGLQYDSGNIPKLLAPNSSDVYIAAGPASLKTYILFFEFNPILTEPFKDSTGPFSFYIPIHLGAFVNSIGIDKGVAAGTYSNLGMELASGIGAEWYSRSPFKLGATALYHYGWGMSGFTNSSSTSQKELENTSGTVPYGGNVGFEFKLTVTYLFGHAKTLAEKAGVD